MNGWAWLAGGIIAVVIGNITAKYSHGYEKIGWGAFSLFMQTLASIGFGMAVKTLPLTVAYSVWVGIVAIGMAVGGYWMFAEKFSGTATLLMSTIIACAVALVWITRRGVS